jgi:hypothetical protein
VKHVNAAQRIIRRAEERRRAQTRPRLGPAIAYSARRRAIADARMRQNPAPGRLTDARLSRVEEWAKRHGVPLPMPVQPGVRGAKRENVLMMIAANARMLPNRKLT